jgi:hypothetical protein
MQGRVTLGTAILAIGAGVVAAMMLMPQLRAGAKDGREVHAQEQGEASGAYEVVIRNAHIIDGTGSPLWA